LANSCFGKKLFGLGITLYINKRTTIFTYTCV